MSLHSSHRFDGLGDVRMALPAGWKPFALGVLGGAIVITWTGFDALGWKTNSAAMGLASNQADAAVIATQASICEAQFKKQVDFAARIAALEKTERYSRGDVILKGGWATMPGSKEPMQSVGQACADLLVP
jgi:hypothetical protein